MELGTKIKKIRELRNFTQDYMAQKLSMSQSGYGKIERDETEVSYQRLQQIAEILSVSVEDITSFNERVVFSQMNNQHATAGYIINQNFNEQQMRLYEMMIQQQKEEIDYLRKMVETLQEQIRRD